MSFKLDPNDLHLVCAATAECTRAFDDTEELSDIAAHYEEHHPDFDVQSQPMSVELVPQCQMCGGREVRVQDQGAFKCRGCGVVMAKEAR